MRRILLFVFSLCSVGAFSQSSGTFTDYLKKQTSGEGTVTVTQDAGIEALVNNTVAREKKTSVKEKESPKQLPAETVSKPAHAAWAERKNNERVVRQRYKATGYRIQIFTGGNSRADRQAAERMERQCQKAFPELSGYVHFVSPRWICRVGDFRTMEEANKYLRLIRKAQISKEARIVKCTVLLAN